MIRRHEDMNIHKKADNAWHRISNWIIKKFTSVIEMSSISGHSVQLSSTLWKVLMQSVVFCAIKNDILQFVFERCCLPPVKFDKPWYIFNLRESSSIHRTSTPNDFLNSIMQHPGVNDMALARKSLGAPRFPWLLNRPRFHIERWSTHPWHLNLAQSRTM